MKKIPTRQNSSQVEAIERKLINWFTHLRTQGYIVTQGSVRLKALERATKDKSLATQDLLVDRNPAVTWRKYCRYGIKLYPINQSTENTHSPETTSLCVEEVVQLPQLCP